MVTEELKDSHLFAQIDEIGIPIEQKLLMEPLQQE
eukprot:IDg19366t1